MLKPIRVYKGGMAGLGRTMEKQGFTGICDGYPNAVTITIVKPGADLNEVISSLELTLKDLELRKAHNQRIAQIENGEIQ